MPDFYEAEVILRRKDGMNFLFRMNIESITFEPYSSSYEPKSHINGTIDPSSLKKLEEYLKGSKSYIDFPHDDTKWKIASSDEFTEKISELSDDFTDFSTNSVSFEEAMRIIDGTDLEDEIVIPDESIWSELLSKQKLVLPSELPHLHKIMTSGGYVSTPYVIGGYLPDKHEEFFNGDWKSKENFSTSSARQETLKENNLDVIKYLIESIDKRPLRLLTKKEIEEMTNSDNTS